MINFGQVKLVNHGSTICFLASKNWYLQPWDSKTDLTTCNQRKLTLHVYSTTLYSLYNRNNTNMYSKLCSPKNKQRETWERN